MGRGQKKREGGEDKERIFAPLFARSLISRGSILDDLLDEKRGLLAVYLWYNGPDHIEDIHKFSSKAYLGQDWSKTDLLLALKTVKHFRDLLGYKYAAIVSMNDLYI